ncbi:MAG: serine--pyruvate aminotransferase [Acidobacteria bacterium]|nr:MAG: serine--pyruvate aminotransferase [Acidobacteriota bacterium]
MTAEPGVVARAALALTDWAERWVPDAFIFALLATFLVLGAAATTTGSTIAAIVDAWGRGFWELIPFTLQMSLIIITGHVLATSPPMGRVIRAIAGWPRSPRGAVALVTAFTLAASWINWGFSLVFGAVLAIEVARRVKGVDYRALAAASVLGLGSIWAQGLSGSAALQMATPGALQPEIRDIVAAGGIVPGGIISFRHTIFLWQSAASVVVEMIVVTLVMWLATPPPSRARTARDLGIDLGESASRGESRIPNPESRSLPPGQRLEHSRVLTWLVVALGGAYLARYFWQAGDPLSALTLNVLNLAFLMMGFLLHGTPARLMRAVQAATPAVWGVILQFPFYAGIAGVITGTNLGRQLADLFVRVSTRTTFPPLVALYSAVLGVFVPSGGSKWVIEAPYVMQAAHTHHVHLGWIVSAYDLGEALANLLQPFWMLPVLGLFKLAARDVMGYTMVVCLALTPVVLILVTLLGLTLSYPL